MMIRKKITRFVLMGDSVSPNSALKPVPANTVQSNHSQGPLPEPGRLNPAWSAVFNEVLTRQLKLQFFTEKKAPRPADIIDCETIDCIQCYDKPGLVSCHSPGSGWSFWKQLPGLRPPCLSDRRQALLRADQRKKVTLEQRQATLVVENSGLNDLARLEDGSNKKAIERIVEARLDNVMVLYQQGYRHFVLFDLLDLSLTPRFHGQTKEVLDQLQANTLYFNRLLKKKARHFRKTFNDLDLDILDVEAFFESLYDHSEEYGMDPAHLTQSFIGSPEASTADAGDALDTSYLFWDDLHPHRWVYDKLANHFYQSLSVRYAFRLPAEEAAVLPEKTPVIEENEEALLEAFREAYVKRWERDISGCWGAFFRRSGINYRQADLKTIFRHALFEQGHRTRSVIIKLGWLDRDGHLKSDHATLKWALALASQEHTRKINQARTEKRYSLSMRRISSIFKY